MNTPPPAVAELLRGWHYPLAIPVQWGEMDAAGHVNNTVYYRYFESARVELLLALAREGLDLMGFSQGPASSNPIGVILGASSCRFKLPLRHPDVAWAASRLRPEGFHAHGFELEHVVISETHGRVAAQGSALLYCYDYVALRKAELPAGWRERLSALLP